MKSICVNCEHLLEETYFSRWEAHPCRVCKARPLPRGLNYVTGVRSPQRYARCFSFNRYGRCRLFEERERYERPD